MQFYFHQAMHAARMYIAETSPTQIRGRLLSLKEFSIVFGMLLGYISGSIYVDLIGGWPLYACH
ncbi:unnamed protein product [Musa acuminata subsp. malaccensis]|uniref:(wild Malaysian banana) hypothetical protein n=1 Tax=Musa acuminata subsp. malaccensis TaxID=214687 RepID=A0A804L7C1_MUSAM|nr:unnamed protein product [Musa acuminata subsp. malaccensis]